MKSAELSAYAHQEVFAEADGSLAVKYTITVANQTPDVPAEQASVKAVLGSRLSVYDRAGQTGGMHYVENIGWIPEGLDFSELSWLSAGNEALTRRRSSGRSSTSAAVRRGICFYAKIEESVQDPAEIPVLFFVSGNGVPGESVSWSGTELLEARTFAEDAEEPAADPEASEEEFRRRVQEYLDRNLSQEKSKRSGEYQADIPGSGNRGAGQYPERSYG